MDLIAFLRARLDEDEQTARAAMWDDDQSAVWTARPPRDRHERYIVADYCDDGVVAVNPYNADEDGVGRHIARHDPARVLAEVDAKRRILDLHREKLEHGYSSDFCAECDFGRTSQTYYPCATLRLLALPYADHPDYQDDWRP